MIDRSILTGPRLMFYTVNMTSREITITFDEAIHSFADITGITIQGNRGELASVDYYYRLTWRSSYRVDGNNVLKITLSDSDFDALQLRQDVATMRTNTYLAMERRTVADRSNLRIMAEQISGSDAVAPIHFVGDSTPPEIISYSLDLSTNSMAFTFNELVNVSSFAPERIAILSQPFGGMIYNLTEGTVHRNLPDTSRVVSFTLVDNDVLYLKLNTGIATGMSNTYLVALEGLATDITGDANHQSQPLQVSSFVPDTVGPSVVSFDLNMITGQLEIHFNDPVDVSTFNPTGITLQSSLIRQPSQFHRLSQNSISNSSVGFMITVDFSNDIDLNQIKRIRNLCSAQQNCYIFVTATLIRDLNNANVVPIPHGFGLRVTNYTGDTTSPKVTRWELDVDRGRVVLTFTETVDIRTFQLNQLTLQNGSDIFSPKLSLTGFVALDPSDANNIFSIQLNANDLNAIKGNHYLGTNVDSSFISVTAETIADMNSNSLVPISNNSALVVTSFTADTTSPVLASFSLDLTQRMLSLTFNEIVNASSFDVSSLTLVNRESQSSVRYTLTDGYVSNVNSDVLRVLLSPHDISAINALGYLASTQYDTYIITTTFTVQDLNNNPLAPISVNSALRVAQYVGNEHTDRLIQLGFQNYTTREGETVRLRIFLNATAARDVTFTVATRDGSAVGEYKTTLIILSDVEANQSLYVLINVMHFPAPGDYQPLNGVVSIPAGGTQQFVEIPIGVDYDIEGTESFEIVLSSPSEGAVIAQTVATINIIDVDSKSNALYHHMPHIREPCSNA